MTISVFFLLTHLNNWLKIHVLFYNLLALPQIFYQVYLRELRNINCTNISNNHFEGVKKEYHKTIPRKSHCWIIFPY